MMRRQRLFFFFAAGLLAASQVAASPFGLSKGMDLPAAQSHGAFQPIFQNPRLYTAKKIAHGRSGFVHYTALITPKQGLCKVWADSVEMATGSHGDDLAAGYRALVAALAIKYGAPDMATEYEQRVFGSNRSTLEILLDRLGWKGKQEKGWASFWIAPGLPDSIRTIAVEAGSLSPGKGVLTLAYEFDNLQDCLETSAKPAWPRRSG